MSSLGVRRLLPLPLLLFALLGAAPAARAAVVEAGLRGASSPLTLFGGVSAAWGGAISSLLTNSASSPGGLTGVLTSLQKVNVADPMSRMSMAPVVLQLSIRGYSVAPGPDGTGFALLKGAEIVPLAAAEADFKAAAADGASNVRFAAQTLIGQAHFGEAHDTDMLDTAAKLRMLGTGLSFYMSPQDRAEVLEAFSYARSRLSSQAKKRLSEAISRQVLAFGRMSGDGLTVLEDVERSEVSAPLGQAKRPLPKEWKLQPYSKINRYAAIEPESLSPAFRSVPDERARDILAAQYLAKSPSELASALEGVELPPVLAYKAASIAWRDDLQGAFSEIGAAQKISENIYKIKGQKILAASRSAYSREASDQRYSSPKENPTSEDYTSYERLRRQLSQEYDDLKPLRAKNRFALATTARTSWGDGHAWLGIKAQLAPGKPPATIVMHVRLLGDRTRNQKDILGAIGISALFGAYYHLDDLPEFVRGLGDGISSKDFEIDYLSVALPDGGEHAGLAGGLELLRQGLARRILLSPEGLPMAPAQAARDHALARWSFVSDRKPLGVVAPGLAAAAPSQDEPILVDVLSPEGYAARRSRNWTLLSTLPVDAAELEAMFHPASKKADVVLAPIVEGAHSPTDYKAKRLNREAWVKGVFIDVGGYQSVVTRFFEASSSHAIFDSLSFSNPAQARAHYGPQGDLSDTAYLRKQLGQEFTRIGEHERHRRFVIATAVKKTGARLGLVGLRFEDEPGGAVSEVVISFRFRGGTWQQRRNALAALGVNLIYAYRYGGGSKEDLLQRLQEDMPGVTADLKIVEAAG